MGCAAMRDETINASGKGCRVVNIDTVNSNKLGSSYSPASEVRFSRTRCSSNNLAAKLGS